MSKFVTIITADDDDTEVLDVEINWKGLADEVDALVIEYMKEMMDRWRDDVEMRIMFLADTQDGLEVCKLLAMGSWWKAERKLRNMDTAARDIMYDIIEQVAGKEFFDHVR
jgi:hypothetical protein